VTASFYAEHLFLARRYLIAFSLVLMLWVPFGLEKLIQQRQQRFSRSLLTITMLLMLISAIGGLFEFGHSKNHIRLAGDWLATNTNQQSIIYVNSVQLMYYSQHHRNDFFPRIKEYVGTNIFTNDAWKKYDYIALNLSQDESATIKSRASQNQWAQLTEFSNTHGDKVIIYQVRR
jgi:hypothetical protein